MENCIISNVMTRRVSERIQKQRDGFLILVEEYSGTDSDSESELEEDTPFRGRGTTRLKTQTNRDRLYMDGVKLSTKLNTFSQNLVQVNPEEKTQVSKIPPTCYTCNEIFNTIDELYFHGLAHSTKSVQCQETLERESYKCNICNAILKDRSFVRLHVAKHNYIRCQCIMCPKTFCSPSYLSQHIKHEHEGIKYTCPHCPKSYTQNANLKQHMLSHEGVYFTCYHCGREFTNRALLVRHMGVHKENRKRYKCKVCKRSMICPKAYKKHMKYHQGLSEFVCLICAKKFMDKHTFVRHMDRHESPTEYKCNVCKRTYVDKKLLERHVLRHFREDFVCEICGKAYVDQKVLDDHVLQHEGHTYPCDQCDNTYTYLSNLKRHQRVHMKKRRMFICAICNIKLTTKMGLRYHLTTHDVLRKTVDCKLCNTVLKEACYSSHFKSVFHQEKLKNLMARKLKRKLIKAEVIVEY